MLSEKAADMVRQTRNWLSGARLSVAGAQGYNPREALRCAYLRGRVPLTPPIRASNTTP